MTTNRDLATAAALAADPELVAQLGLTRMLDIGPRHRANGDASRISRMMRPGPRHRAGGRPDSGQPFPTRASLVRVDGSATIPIPLRTAPTITIPAVPHVVPFGVAVPPER